jgi:hypothetical protein
MFPFSVFYFDSYILYLLVKTGDINGETFANGNMSVTYLEGPRLESWSRRRLS